MTSLSYIYDRLPILLLFATGYILYRVIASVGLPEYFSSKAVKFSHGKVDSLLLALIFVSAALSMFIPNAVTVLAMIPVIRKLDSELESMTTPLTLSIIYGANIGGMGSLIGSPANLLLIGALDLFKVEGRDQITFLNWFIWAIPVVVVFLLLAWIVVRRSIPKEGTIIPEGVASQNDLVSLTQKQGMKVFCLFICFWSATSIIREFYPAYARLEPVVSMVFTVTFILLIFSRLAFGFVDKNLNVPLMDFEHLIQGVPKRGLLFLGVLGGVVLAVRLIGLDQSAANWFTGVLNAMEVNGQGGYLIYLVTALVVILLTELLSNTVVSVAFFAVMVHTASTYGVNPMGLMILVSVASTCAFMTPIATPCNSIAFGEMKSVSLRSMLGLGLLLNISGAVLLSFWVWKVIPYIYR